MVEPTESEGKTELDRYCDALISKVIYYIITYNITYCNVIVQ